MLPSPLSLPSSASKAALRRRALGSRAPSVAMLDDGSGHIELNKGGKKTFPNFQAKALHFWTRF